jgi:hypothetical protein
MLFCSQTVFVAGHCFCTVKLEGPEKGKPKRREKLGTVYLLVLTSLIHLLFMLIILFTFFYKLSYLNEEVNCTEPFPSVRLPWFQHRFFFLVAEWGYKS